MLIIKLTMNRNINTVINGAEDHRPAIIPHTMNIHITVTTKNKFQLSNKDCLVDFVL